MHRDKHRQIKIKFPHQPCQKLCFLVSVKQILGRNSLVHRESSSRVHPDFSDAPYKGKCCQETSQAWSQWKSVYPTLLWKMTEEEARLFSLMFADRTRGNFWQKFKTRIFHLNTWKRFFTLSGQTGCPGRLKSFHLWRYSKPNWTWSWAPALAEQGWLDQMISRDPFQLQPFCDWFCEIDRIRKWLKTREKGLW